MSTTSKTLEPFATRWVGENYNAPWPIALYGLMLLFAANKGRTEVIQMLVDRGADLQAHDFGSRDTVNGAMKGLTWIALDWSRGLVRVGVQSAI